MYVQRNITVRPPNHCCHGKATLCSVHSSAMCDFQQYKNTESVAMEKQQLVPSPIHIRGLEL